MTPPPETLVTAIIAGLTTALIALPLAAWRGRGRGRRWITFVPAIVAVVVWGTPAVFPALLATCLAMYIMRRPRPSDRHLLDRHAR